MKLTMLKKFWILLDTAGNYGKIKLCFLNGCKMFFPYFRYSSMEKTIIKRKKKTVSTL